MKDKTSRDQEKYLHLLSQQYPNKQSLCREVINLNAILNLPKGTEHFMSDLHGEFEAFYHILNNCSGVIREKVDLIFKDTLTEEEKQEICTLIYYPEEKLKMLHLDNKLSDEWYRMVLNQLIKVAKLLSSKYTRSKVRKAMPEEFAYIIDELLHVQKDEDNNQVVYHKKIIDTILDLDYADEFIIALAALIKRLAVDHLHIVGDIFDRGAYADRILDMLMQHHSLDIQWGNHDILWMGAASGSTICVAIAVMNCLKSDSISMLERSYGISLRRLFLFAEKYYDCTDMTKGALRAISVIMFKLHGRIIKRHPEYNMDDQLMLHRVDRVNGTVEINGVTYELNNNEFLTVSDENPYELTDEEGKVILDLKKCFTESERLQAHVKFLYDKGSMYKVFNDNLLYHGCVPLDKSGNFDYIQINDAAYKGKALMEYAEVVARRAFFGGHDKNDLDFMWYLWGGRKSPLCGRNLKTFERAYIDDQDTWLEEANPYYSFNNDEKTCNMILREFGIYAPVSHIINGHTPVKARSGEKPIRANGKLFVIDGGFCKAYHKKTGIAGYTLIYNSHGLRIKAHQPFSSVAMALMDNQDIESESSMVEEEKSRVMVKDTDIGKHIQEDIDDLNRLMKEYDSF